MNTQLLQELMLYRYRYLIAYIGIFASVVLYLFFQLGSLPGGIAALEAKSAITNASLSNIINNPINFPYKLLQFSTVELIKDPVWAARLPSAIFGVLNVGLLYALLHIWHRRRIAVVGTILLISSSWFLHTARLGIDIVSLPTALLAIFALFTWYHHDLRWNYSKSILLTICLGVIMYVPYMAMFLLLSVALYRKQSAEFIKERTTPERYGLAAISIAVFIPLITAIFREPTIAPILVGLESGLPGMIEWGKQVIDGFGYVFWNAEPNPAIHLDTLPMLDIFTSTMTALGLYFYERQQGIMRGKLLLGGFFFLLIVASASGRESSYVVLYPFIYIFAATGIIALLKQWYAIFPKNPFARTIALVPIAIVLLSTVAYHTNRYFVAWAQTIETRKTFPEDAVLLRRHIISHVEEGLRIGVIARGSELQRIQYALENSSQYSITFKDNIEEFAALREASDVVYVTDRLAAKLRKQKPVQFVVSSSLVDSTQYWVFR